MSGRAPEFWIPVEQERLLTAEDRNLMDELAHRSLRVFMGDIEARSEDAQYEFDDDGFITLHDMRGESESSSNQALVVLRPFGNGDSPAMLIRDRVYQALLGDEYRVISVPNNTIGRKTYDLPGGHDPVAQLARKTVRGLVRHGIERVMLAGESQGAMLGAFVMALAADDLEIAAVSLKDAPDTVERTPGQLKKDFQGKGLENLHALNQLIRMTGLPALVDAQSAGRGLHRVKQMIGLIGFQFGAMSDENKRLHQAMARRTFVSNITASGLLPELGVHAQVVRYEKSAICTAELAQDMAHAGLTDHLVVVPHLGHEGTDHVVMNALLNRAAINGTDLAA